MSINESLNLLKEKEKDAKEGKNEKEWFVAFDPGKVNFAFIIEEVDKKMMKSFECPSKHDRFTYKNEEDKETESKEEESKKKKHKKVVRRSKDMCHPTVSYINFLEQFYHCGRTVLCANNDITKDFVDNENIVQTGVKERKKRTKKTEEEKQKEKEEKEREKKLKKRGSKTLDAMIFLRLTSLLDRYKEYFDQCSTIIIEQQMSFGSKINTMAIKIAQHTYSYFLFRYGNAKKIIEFPSYNKTQILGAPPGLEKPQRKKWAISKADEIWTLRGDMYTSSWVASKKKKDDMSDCLLHVLSYIIVTKYG